MDQNEFYKLKALKENWKSDPCWDIENTEGFEKHKKELRAFRLETEATWRKKEEDRIKHKANNLECSISLVIYIESLEFRLSNLQTFVDKTLTNMESYVEKRVRSNVS
jgi:3-phenylpropionate/cinnamic acid dioxygenase small subunit